MNFYTIQEAANAIAAHLQPHDVGKRSDVAERYQHLIYDKLCAGELTGRHPDGRYPIDPNMPGAVIALRFCIINESDLNDWLDRLGVGVRVGGNTMSIGPIISVSKSTTGESGVERRIRLRAEREELKAKGVRNFNIVLAKREGVSVSAIKQLTRAEKPKARQPASWHSGIGKA
jgi:hypothetical protein